MKISVLFISLCFSLSFSLFAQGENSLLEQFDQNNRKGGIRDNAEVNQHMKQGMPSGMEKAKENQHLKQGMPSDMERAEENQHMKQGMPSGMEKAKENQHMKQGMPSGMEKAKENQHMKQGMPSGMERAEENQHMKQGMPSDQVMEKAEPSGSSETRAKKKDSKKKAQPSSAGRI